VQGELVEIRTDKWQEAREAVKGFPGVLEVQVFGENLRVFLDPSFKVLPDIVSVLLDHEVSIRGIRKTEPRMEEAFISLIREQGQ
jgi:hypothetical protein